MPGQRRQQGGAHGVVEEMDEDGIHLFLEAIQVRKDLFRRKGTVGIAFRRLRTEPAAAPPTPRRGAVGEDRTGSEVEITGEGTVIGAGRGAGGPCFHPGPRCTLIGQSGPP